MYCQTSLTLKFSPEVMEFMLAHIRQIFVLVTCDVASIESAWIHVSSKLLLGHLYPYDYMILLFYADG